LRRATAKSEKPNLAIKPPGDKGGNGRMIVSRVRTHERVESWGEELEKRTIITNVRGGGRATANE